MHDNRFVLHQPICSLVAYSSFSVLFVFGDGHHNQISFVHLLLHKARIGPLFFSLKLRFITAQIITLKLLPIAAIVALVLHCRAIKSQFSRSIKAVQSRGPNACPHLSSIAIE